MGTNFYHVDGDKRHHIGKSSIGWTFTFHGEVSADSELGQVVNYRQWLDRLEASGHIENEYGETVTLDQFKEAVEQKRGEPRNHCLYVREVHPNRSDDCWLDPDGHSFTEGEFS